MPEEEKESIEKRLKTLMRDGLVKHVKMFEDRTIEIKYAINQDMASTPFKSEYSPDDPAYDVILSLVGEMSPGEFKVCASANRTNQELEIEKVLKPASIAFGIENGDVEKVKRLEDGGICLWMIYDREMPSKELIFSSNAPHIETILKYTGPLEPGQTYVFSPLR